jgi:DNA-directed RNA polymerase subunit RPC12/RpoP
MSYPCCRHCDKKHELHLFRCPVDKCSGTVRIVEEDEVVEETGLPKYKCKHCGKTFERDSDKKWIKSYCSDTGKNVRIVRIAS